MDRFGFAAKKPEMIKEKKILKIKKPKVFLQKIQEKTKKTDEKIEEIKKIPEEKTKETVKIPEEIVEKHEKTEEKSKEIMEFPLAELEITEITKEIPLQKEVICKEISEINGKIHETLQRNCALKKPIPIIPLNFLRKRGRKRKGKWGNKRNFEENCPLTNSLNKIFKKNLVKKPIISKKIPNFQTPNLFENVFRGLLVKDLPSNSIELEKKTPVFEENAEIPLNLK